MSEEQSDAARPTTDVEQPAPAVELEALSERVGQGGSVGLAALPIVRGSAAEDRLVPRPVLPRVPRRYVCRHPLSLADHRLRQNTSRRRGAPGTGAHAARARGGLSSGGPGRPWRPTGRLSGQPARGVVPGLPGLGWCATGAASRAGLPSRGTTRAGAARPASRWVAVSLPDVLSRDVVGETTGAIRVLVPYGDATHRVMKPKGSSSGTRRAGHPARDVEILPGRLCPPTSG